MMIKDEVLNKFKIYNAEVKNLCNYKIKIIRRNERGEYHFPKYCEDMSIVHETYSTYTPQ